MTTRHQRLLDQAALCDFIEQGHLGRHLRRMRKIYLERYRFSASRRAASGRNLEIATIEAGLQTIGRLHGHLAAQGISAEMVAQRAALVDIDVVPLSRYRHTSDCPRSFADRVSPPCTRRTFIAGFLNWPRFLTASNPNAAIRSTVPYVVKFGLTDRGRVENTVAFSQQSARSGYLHDFRERRVKGFSTEPFVVRPTTGTRRRVRRSLYQANFRSPRPSRNNRSSSKFRRPSLSCMEESPHSSLSPQTAGSTEGLPKENCHERYH